MAGHFRIVYRVIEGKIYITNLFDSRMNPKDVFFVGEWNRAIWPVPGAFPFNYDFPMSIAQPAASSTFS
ncbi:MAG: hypothetical protein U0176_21115 [Bacteroidia bacterium]